MVIRYDGPEKTTGCTNIEGWLRKGALLFEPVFMALAFTFVFIFFEGRLRRITLSGCMRDAQNLLTQDTNVRMTMYGKRYYAGFFEIIIIEGLVIVELRYFKNTYIKV